MRKHHLVPLIVLPVVTALAVFVYVYGNQINALLLSPIADKVLLIILIGVDGLGGALVPFLIYRAEQSPQPKLRIVFDVDKTPDRYSIQLDLLALAGSNAVTVRRRFWRACVTNEGGLAEKCKATVSLVKWTPEIVRKFILGEIQLLWESGQLYQDIAARLGSEFVQVVYSDQRTTGMPGDLKAFVSTPDGIQQWAVPVFRAQDALGTGEFEVELKVTSQGGASATKRFKIITTGGWNDHVMKALN